MRRLLSPLFAVLLLLSLAACDSAEERGEEHYQNALTLLAEGDVDRAIVELRNVFRFVPDHREARFQLAQAFQNGKGNARQAYGQYLRIVEQYPDDLEARIELSLLAFQSANWEEMERHGSRAIELAPDDVRVQTIANALNYRSAIEDDDDLERAAAVSTAETLLAQVEGAPDRQASARVLNELIIDNHLRELEFTDALAVIDGLIAQYPDTKRYHMQRLQVLISIGDQPAIEEQLESIVDQYPDDGDMKQMLVRYYLSRGELDQTESFLRTMVEDAEEGDEGPRVELIRFLMELRSVEAASAELVAAIESEPNPAPFIIFKAALDFAIGNGTTAIADLEAAIESAEASSETNEMKVSLAQMLVATGNEVGARSLVEEVLEAEPSQPGALKLNATWLIESDDTDSAISDLRVALDVDPEDAEAMTLMADAYARAGSPGLARDYLSLAVEASGNAPDETVRYVRFLINEERYLPAEDVLLPALRIAPNDVSLLQVAAELYLGMDDVGRLQQVVETLRRQGSDRAVTIANAVEAERLNRVSGSGKAIEYLEQLAQNADADVVSKLMLVRARLTLDDFDGAVALAEEITNENPESAPMQLMLARTLASAGKVERSMSIYETLVQDYPEEGAIWVELAALQTRNGDPDSARTTIESALEGIPDDASVLWAYASFLERDGEIEAAINVYEDLYAEQSGNVVVANNLASLLATYREDEESLERAWTVARRFKDSDIPAVQDTYGWISFRRGDAEEALPYLESAAEQLRDPIVQYHLGEVLFALDRRDEALAQYRTSLSLVGVGDTRPQIIRAREQVVTLEAGLSDSSE